VPNPPATYATPHTTYPGGYYGVVFALSEPVAAVGGLSPYQALYLYRAWTVVLAAALWVVVYRALRMSPETSAYARLILALLLLNPMLAFASSAVTSDAINVPLATLAILWTYRTALSGERPWPATLALMACAFTKPSGLLLVGALLMALCAICLRHRARLEHAGAAALALARAGVIVVLAFYAWSPPRFLAGAPVQATLGQYLQHLWIRLPDLWVMYWGRLGWVDYQLDAFWYLTLAGLVGLNLAYVMRRDAATIAVFCAAVFVAYFVLMAAGEFQLLAVAGYNFQGRHLFPAMVGTCGLVLHPRRMASAALLLVIATMNVLLVVESVERYFGGDWTLLWRSLPV
jgi:Predicted membrane protein (DUF2142)